MSAAPESHSREVDNAHEADQAACLLEAWILAETGVEVADGRMERVSCLDVGGELLRRLAGDVHLLGIAHGLGVGLRHIVDLVLSWQALEETGAQDMVEFVATHAHRFQAHGRAVGLLLQIGQDRRRSGRCPPS